jgi:hypothetical protein
VRTRTSKQRGISAILKFEVVCTLRRLHGMLAVSSEGLVRQTVGFRHSARHSTRPEDRDKKTEHEAREIPYNERHEAV